MFWRSEGSVPAGEDFYHDQDSEAGHSESPELICWEMIDELQQL